MVDRAYPLADDNRKRFHFTSGDTAATPEGTSPATEVYDAQAVHRFYPHQHAQYKLAAGIGDNDLFSIDPATGAVTFKVSPDYEHPADANQDNVYDIVVTARFGQHRISHAVEITVTDVAPSAPTDGNPAANSVVEGAPAGTNVGLTASSSDVNGGTVTYSIIGDSSGGGFTVDHNTGVVTVADASKIDYESAPSHAYTVTVAASDGTLSSSSTFTIAVGDAPPSAPADSDTRPNSVIEGAAAGTYTGLTASSSDVNGGTVTYSITNDSSGGGFTVDHATGVITVADPSKIDYQTSGPNHQYAVTVAASDGTLSSSSTFAIAVTDAAPSTPVDKDTTNANSVAEGATAGTYTGLTASSSDFNNHPVTYSMSDDAGGRFAIDPNSGAVAVTSFGASHIDYESAPGHAYAVTVVASDGTLTSAQTFSIAVTDVAPTVPVDSDTTNANSITEGAPAATYTGLTAASTDVNGGTVTYSFADDAGGRFAIDPTSGKVTVSNYGASHIDYESSGGSYNVTVKAADPSGAFTTQTFTIAVGDAPPSTPTDSDPATDAVLAHAAAGTTVGVTAASSDPNGGTVTYSLVGDTSNGGFQVDPGSGVVSVLDPTKIDYHASGASHSYTVTVKAADPSGDATSQAFTIAVLDNPPVANGDSYSVTAENTLTVNAATGVLANDTDKDGDPLTAVLATGPAHGTLSLNANGSFTYTPTTGFHGSDSFTYTANDGTENSAPATVNIAVADNAPVANADAYSVQAEGTLTVAAKGVLANDTDADNDPLTAVLATGPAHGNLTLNADGSFTYTPTANFHGSDSFTYYANDGTENSAQPTTVAITVADNAPVANADTYSVQAEGTLTVAAKGVLANDTDADNDPLTAVLKTGPAHGTLSLNPDGSFTYTPTAGFHGSDSFTYIANDGTDNSAPATVSLTVADNAPVANADTYTVQAEGTLTVAAKGVLTNDTDADNDPLTAVLKTGPAHGSLTLNPDGSFTYTPTANFHGSDSFTYYANDGTDNSAPTTVSLTVVDNPPVAVNDTYSMTAETGLRVTAGNGVLANDTDADNDPLTAVLKTGPAHGTLNLNPDGSFTYMPTTGFHGSDSFTYYANDGTTNSAQPATVSITVNDNPPVANPDNYSVTAENTLTVTVNNGVLANDTDVDNDPLTAVLKTSPSHGTLTLNPDGSFTYTPTANYHGTDIFTYYANDGTANSAPTTVTIAVKDNAPVAVNDSYTAVINQTLTVPAATGVLANDTDADHDPLTATIVAGPQHGTLTLDANGDGGFSYTPTTGYSGSDSFTYKANDGTDNSNLATVNLTVIVDAPPMVTAGHNLAYTEGDGAKPFDQNITVTDSDSPNLASATVQISGGYVSGEDYLGFTNQNGITGAFDQTTGTLTLSGSATQAQYTTALQSVTYTDTSQNPSTAQRTLTITANDGTVSSAPATDTISVTSVDNPPTNAVPGAQAVKENQSLTFSTANGNAISVNDVDVGSGDLQVTLSVAHGALTLSGSTGLTVTGNNSNNVELTGTEANVNAALAGLVYAPTVNTNGSDTLTIATDDLGNTGTGGPYTTTSTVGITVTEVNQPPSFTLASNETKSNETTTATAVSVPNFATAISPGPGDSGQTVHFNIVGDTNAAMFSVAPTISASGTLTYTANPYYSGTATITVDAQDNGGTANGGSDTSATQTFAIDVAPVANAPNFATHLTPTPVAGVDVTVNTVTAYPQDQAAVAALAGGGYVVAFHGTDPNLNNGNDPVQAQIYDASGNAVGGELTLTDMSTANGEVTAYVGLAALPVNSGAGLPSGGSIVTYAIQDPYTGGTALEGRIFTSAGTQVGSEFAISTFSPVNGEISNPSVAVAPDGTYVVTWSSTTSTTDQSGSHPDILMQQYNANHVAVGGNVIVDTTGVASGAAASGHFSPDVAELINPASPGTAAGYVVTWTNDTDYTNPYTTSDVYARIYNASGTPAGNDFLVNTANTTGEQDMSSVAALKGGGFAISWTSDPTGGNAGASVNPNIYVELFNSNGSAKSATIQVNASAVAGSGTQQTGSSIVALPDGGFLVTYNTAANGGDVAGQRFDANGNKVGGEFQIDQSTTYQQYQDDAAAHDPVAILNNGQAVAAFTSVTQTGQNPDTDVHSQTFNIPGDGAQNAAHISLGTITATPSDTVGTSPTNGGQEVVKEIDISGIPTGYAFTFSVGHAGSTAGTWVIDNAADISSLSTTPLTINPPSGYHGNFTLNVTATVTDTATLSTGSQTSTQTTAPLTIPVGVKAPGDPIVAADTAGVTPLHLDPVGQNDTVTITNLPGNGDLTLADGTAVHANQVLSASQFAGLAFKPLDLGADTNGSLQFTVSDGTSQTVNTIPVNVLHGTGLTLDGSVLDDHIIGSPGADVLVGHGGHDILTGGGGADHFVFDQTALSGPKAAEITDYHAHQGAVIDVSALTSAFEPSGGHAAALFHVIEDAGGAFATLDVNTGTAQAPHWAEVAQLDGLHAGSHVTLAVDPAHPGGLLHLHVESHGGIV